MFVRRFLCHTSCFSVFFFLLKKPSLIFFSTSCELIAHTGILYLAFNLSPTVKFGLNFLTVSLTSMMQSQQLSPKQKFKEFLSSFPPKRPKIKFQGFSRTSRSSTNPDYINNFFNKKLKRIPKKINMTTLITVAS